MASGINRITRTAGAIATALLALSGQTPTALAARTEPMIAPDGTHYADLIIQQAADYDDFYNGVLGMPLSTGEISSAELAGVNLGFNYFWDMIGDSFKAQKPVQILVSTENASSANASAFSPSHQSITELAAAWSGDENVSDIAAGLKKISAICSTMPPTESSISLSLTYLAAPTANRTMTTSSMLINTPSTAAFIFRESMSLKFLTEQKLLGPRMSPATIRT